MRSRDIRNFADESDRVTSLVDLRRLVEAAAVDAGFEFVALLHSPALFCRSSNLIRLDNYPIGWEERLVSRAKEIVDPVLTVARRRVCTVIWPDDLLELQLSVAQRSILADAHQLGLRKGVTIPTNVPGEPEGSVTFATSREQSIEPERAFMVEAIGRDAFERARRLSGRPLVPTDRMPISKRVRECIFWIAQGKTDQDTADILGIGVGSVHTYVKNAFRLLDVISRAQLVHEALRQGIIDFLL